MINVSIIILICDNDFQYLTQSLACIDHFVKTSHQVIVVDNRVQRRDVLPEGNYTLVSPGHNTYCFEGRRLGCEAAIGKYIWYIDVDDEICGFLTDEDLSRDVDVFQMYIKTEKYELAPGSFHGYNQAFPDGVWSRLCKRELLQRVYAPIKRDLKIVQFEDLALRELVFRENPEVDYIDKIMYFYITERSVNFSQEPNKNKYKNSQIGEEDLEYLYTFIDDGANKIGLLRKVREDLIKNIEGRLK